MSIMSDMSKNDAKQGSNSTTGSVTNSVGSSVTSATGKTYYPVIGLEIHAELKTRSKMFCSCKNDPDEETPNTNVCAICMGHPGTLPVLNKQAIQHVLRVGVSMGADIADYTEWDRKNYFYPDIPKGYQISQYAYPLIKNGSLTVKGADGTPHTVLLTRVHLEEDTAKSSHDKGDYSLVDFNRAGLPLMELVTEPVIHNAKTAAAFAKELQLLLRALGAGDAHMEKGEMRVEANISVSTDPRAHAFPYDVTTFGRKVEVKNLNSFRSAERAIELEIARHIDMIERGETIVQETRGFDETTGKTFSQRIKEDSHDYRYFPDPDLPKLFISEIPEFATEKLRAELPTLPWQKRDMYIKNIGMKDEDAEMFVQNEMLSTFFDAATTLLDPATTKIATNYITSDIVGLIKKAGGDTTRDDCASDDDATREKSIRIAPPHFAELMNMIGKEELSSRTAKDILAVYWSDDSSVVAGVTASGPQKYAEDKGLIQKNDPEALKRLIEKLLEENPGPLADYKAGKQAALQFFIGQIMKSMKGAVNPEVARNTLVEIIG